MTRILLDTSAYSAFMRGHQGVQAALRGAEEIFLTPVILGELLAGFMRGRHRRKNEGELDAFLTSPRVDVVTMDRETGERYALILHGLRQAGTPIPTNDIWIAGSAMQHGLRILTTDAHYLKVTQAVVDFVESA